MGANHKFPIQATQDLIDTLKVPAMFKDLPQLSSLNIA